eukprot:365378-Chlamydomonas_euryale.AAC.14
MAQVGQAWCSLHGGTYPGSAAKFLQGAVRESCKPAAPPCLPRPSSPASCRRAGCQCWPLLAHHRSSAFKRAYHALRATPVVAPRPCERWPSLTHRAARLPEAAVAMWVPCSLHHPGPVAARPPQAANHLAWRAGCASRSTQMVRHPLTMQRPQVAASLLPHPCLRWVRWLGAGWARLSQGPLAPPSACACRQHLRSGSARQQTPHARPGGRRRG